MTRSCENFQIPTMMGSNACHVAKGARNARTAARVCTSRGLFLDLFSSQSTP